MIAPLAIKGVYVWSQWQPDRGMFFNSHLVARDGGNVAIDPLILDTSAADQIDRLGGVRTIILTNRDHERAAANMRERWNARVISSAGEAALFSIPIDATFSDGEEVFAGAFSIELSGAKTAGEIALHLPEANSAIVGDALIGAPVGALSLLPDEKLRNPSELLLSLRKLWALRLNALLLGDGASIMSGADDALASLLEERGGISINRINLDELCYERNEDPKPFTSEDAEIGLLIGARKLGYRTVRLRPGEAFCPLHAHALEEEMCLVLEGEPTVRTLRGTLRLRRGDFVAFPTGLRGAHQLRNDSDSPAVVMILGMEDLDEVAVYPDSDKMLLRRGRVIVRSSPRLDYFDGEVGERNASSTPGRS